MIDKQIRGEEDRLNAWNFNVMELMKRGLYDNAMRSIEHMEKIGIDPNVITFNSVIDGLVKMNRIGDALKSLNSMKQDGPSSDKQTYTYLMNGYLKQKDMPKALQVLAEMNSHRLDCSEPSTFSP